MKKKVTTETEFVLQEKRKGRIDALICKTYGKAPTDLRIQELQRQRTEVLQNFLNGTIDFETYKSRFAALKWTNGGVLLENLYELRFALGLIHQPMEMIEKILAHVDDYGKAAQQIPAVEVRYWLQAMKVGDLEFMDRGGLHDGFVQWYSFSVSVLITWPDNLPEETARNLLKACVTVPLKNNEAKITP